MMGTGLQALLLAVVTALPFTPPAGWVKLPQSAVSAHVSNVWKGPKPGHGPRARFTAVVFPFPGSLAMLASTDAKISGTPMKLCGVPARLVTKSVRIGGGHDVVQEEMAVKNGYAYMLVYTRPSTVRADADITHVMHTFCPSGGPSMQALAMPHGWTRAVGQMQMVGAWMGTRPGEVMTLMHATHVASLNQAFASAQNGAVRTKSGKVMMQITMRKRVTMCGNPGMLSDLKVTAGMPMSMHLALTQRSGEAYVLMYMQMGTAPVDPAGMTALKTLCISGVNTSPSAAPATPAAASPSPNPAHR